MSKDKKQKLDELWDAFDNYEPSVPLSETISQPDLMRNFPQIEPRKFWRYQQAGALHRVRQIVGSHTFGKWKLRYREQKARSIMERISMMDEWNKYRLVSRIIELEEKIEKMKKRGVKDIRLD